MKPLYTPTNAENTNLSKFRCLVEAKSNTSLPSYSELYRWSVENFSDFWNQVWIYCGIKSSSPYHHVVAENSQMNDLERIRPTWFPGA